ncbi:hypothetical protein HJB86_14620 [Rhizobium sp. NZLR3b]|uniref:hypothetical protein n=1 Tax=Rhizobium sp. NZLR3b TaxID=2731101 RepID=UPI001C83A75D|nr:hypothetical protein [Rhizobium sp. NZLR3b]MBX5190141.1 hypothetical protein [Rhizobium sp. NZLR3b]
MTRLTIVALGLLAIGVEGCVNVVDKTIHPAAIEMSCSIITNQCVTPTWGLREGTFDGETIPFKFATPAGWKLTGHTGASYSGQEVFDVTVLAWGKHFLTCQWHAEGSKQLFGPGGWVSGYCYATGTTSGAEFRRHGRKAH